MGEGPIARKGSAVIDDTASMLFQDGLVAPSRPGHRIDGYLLGYGHAYKSSLKAFYRLSGKQPILP